MRSLAACVVLVLTLPSAAQTAPVPPPPYERILLPISFRGEIPGAFGTRWTSQILMYNDSAEDVLFIGPACNPSEGAHCKMPQTIGSRRFVHIQAPPSAEPGSQGAFIHIWRSARRDLSFAARLRDESRAEENAGTELPVVRPEEFRKRIVIPQVLTRGPFRTALRIYAINEAPATVRLRMYRLDRAQAFVDEVVQLQGINTLVYDSYPTHPAFFHVYDLLARWPVLEAAASVRIELDSEQYIWAFASHTNNTTQLVTTVRPQ